MSNDRGDDSRYAPPAAVVADPPEPPGVEMPKRVRQAVQLLWYSFALGIPVVLIELTRDRAEYAQPGAFAVTVAIYLLLFALAALLNVKIARGRNWARVTGFLLYLLGLYFVMAPNDDPEAPSVIVSMLNFVSVAIESVAYYWLFTSPGSGWFRRRR